MAFFTKLVIAFTALATLSAARPLAVRDATSMVTETAWTTVDVPVTLWVDEKGTPLSTVAQGGAFAAASATASSPAAAAPTSSMAQPEVLHSSALPSQPQASAPAPVVPTTSAAAAPQVTAAPAPAVPQSSTYQAPAAAPSSSAPAAAPSAPAAPANQGSSGQAASAQSANFPSQQCVGAGASCSGDITHWDGGLGACGWNVNTASDMQIALPYGLMGTQSNGNPYCGASLTIKNPNTGATIQATVGDKCMGCTGASIDMTDALFNAIGGGCDGRCSGFNWWFN